LHAGVKADQQAVKSKKKSETNTSQLGEVCPRNAKIFFQGGSIPGGSPVIKKSVGGHSGVTKTYCNWRGGGGPRSYGGKNYAAIRTKATFNKKRGSVEKVIVEKGGKRPRVKKTQIKKKQEEEKKKERITVWAATRRRIPPTAWVEPGKIGGGRRDRPITRFHKGG